MVREYYEEICTGREVRQNLISLRSALKDEREKRSFAYLLAGDFSELVKLLKHEDPKVRKNAALILGDMESEDILPILFDAYKNEMTRFVRTDYLQAMKKLDYGRYVPELKERLKILQENPGKEEEKKHRLEEIRTLQSMILQYEGIRRHRFDGERFRKDVIMTTNRNQREVTARQITGGKITMLQGGIRVKDVEVEQLLPIRTYTEMLFPVAGLESVDGDPEKMGRTLADGRLLHLVQQLHEGLPPFYYRIELKSGLAQDKKGAFIRRVSEVFEQSSGGSWINSAADYELELRLIQKKDGTFLVMVKFYTIPDIRFRYRKESVASSITPVNAAITAELARPYLKENAQILDPFCGVGTMLIERNLAVRARNMYGIDIYGDAIEKARINTAHIGMHVNYINKDFFEFEHEYLFDEIITDMPQVTLMKPRREIRETYAHFFDRAGHVLKEDGVMILYASEPEFVYEEVKQNHRYRICESFLVNERQGTSVFVLKTDQ